MRLERLNMNKIKIFLTFDDLSERGLTKDDLWHDRPKVHQLFRDMINEASDELGFEVDGPLAIEIFALQAQGMVVIVTKEILTELDDEDEDEEFTDEYIQMQVTLDECTDIFYEMKSFEDVISLCKRLISMNIDNGNLYSFNNKFYFELEVADCNLNNKDVVIAILAEYGDPSTLTTYRIREYGKLLIEQNAVKTICNYFK